MRLNNRGFTLVEVLAAIVIVALIGTLVAPNVISMIKTGKDASDMVLIDNINSAAEGLYQEVEYMNTNVYKYGRTGKTSDTVIIDDADKSITVNLQTLVGNGFLDGINNEDSASPNKNKKIILDADNNDIGQCNIKITKIKNYKVCYKIEGMSGDECPSTLDFGGDKQCMR